MKLTHLTILLALFSILNTSYSQEVRGLNYNPALRNSTKKPKLKSSGAPLIKQSVPQPAGHIFFDDFSTYGSKIYPNSKSNWIDNSATITRTYTDSSVSIGAATLDCFDAQGRVYGPTRRVNPSDTLTSVLIDSIETNSLYLSFFIQGGGKADPPEEQDSIILEFLHHKSNTWITAWDTNGYTSHTFKQIILPINDTLYSDSCFQFRFVNFTSLSADEVQGNEGALSNADMWHIDYLQLKSAANRNEMTQINDVAVYETPKPIFKNYSHIPYDHLQYAASRLIEDIDIAFRTFFPSETNAIKIGRTNAYIDYTNNDTLEIAGRGEGIQLDYPPVSFERETDKFKPLFKTERYPDQKGEGVFQHKTYINFLNEQNQYKWNDTVTREDVFRGFYAYDDGSAEYGFGISGADAYNTAFASKFDLYYLNNVADTLTGLYIYFNHAADEFNSDLEFEVAVWEIGTDNLPGELIYRTGEENLFTPDTNTSLNNPSNSSNGFMPIKFDEGVPVTTGYYIGLIQYTNEFLNVGYDVSFGSKANIVYYADNQWASATSIQGIPEGSLMIRPKFDYSDYPTAINHIYNTPLSVEIFPNPANTIININLPDRNSTYQYKIYNLLGKQVDSNKLNGNTINIEQIPAGMYFIQIQDLSSKQIYTQKILKTTF